MKEGKNPQYPENDFLDNGKQRSRKIAYGFFNLVCALSI